MDRDDWDRRYAAEPLLWGKEPNSFVAAALASVSHGGRALDVACGEGRNAIWLAGQGWRVTAVDYSPVAVERARRLAAEADVRVEWIEADILAYRPPAGTFDLVLVAYLHLPGPARQRVLERAASALAPGGVLFMIGHARRNLAEGVGGPQDPDVLWELGEVRGELERLGLVIRCAEEVLRPMESPEGTRYAIDSLLRAERPGNRGRARAAGRPAGGERK